METPITLDNSQQAFQYASQYDYNARVARPAPRPGYRSGYGGPGYPPPPPPYYGGYFAAPYPYYPNPYFYGPSLYFGFGGGRWGRRW
jgi:hypothetical protein